MTVLNISKLSFYVLLLSVAFAQILVVSAAENNLDSDDVDSGITGGLKVDAKMNGSVHDIASWGVKDVFTHTGFDSDRTTRWYFYDFPLILQGFMCRSNIRLQLRRKTCVCGTILMCLGHAFVTVKNAEEEAQLLRECADESFVNRG
ncbi:hypothetical protein F4604DRAFT_1899060 [Suillus subluteus]|nr:hypothetical protein F4604DRAFT_1899060 [Suillus subluteus]